MWCCTINSQSVTPSDLLARPLHVFDQSRPSKRGECSPWPQSPIDLNRCQAASSRLQHRRRRVWIALIRLNLAVRVQGTLQVPRTAPVVRTQLLGMGANIRQDAMPLLEPTRLSCAFVLLNRQQLRADLGDLAEQGLPT